jgi:hypothetical protein
VEEAYSSGTILSDLRTRPFVKGPDHPTYFAKGTYENDNTVGGKGLEPSASL